MAEPTPNTTTLLGVGQGEVAWQNLQALRIEARCDVRNERSWRLVEKLGFELEGVAKNDDRDAAGVLCSTKVYALTREGAGTSE